MLEFLRSEGIDENLIKGIEKFRKEYPLDSEDEVRLVKP